MVTLNLRDDSCHREPRVAKPDDKLKHIGHYVLLTDVSIRLGVSIKLSCHSSNINKVQRSLRWLATPRSCSSCRRETYSGLKTPALRTRSGDRRSRAKGRSLNLSHSATGTPKPFLPRRVTNRGTRSWTARLRMYLVLLPRNL